MMNELQQLHAFTSESVSEGHPDKVADQISDAILDAYLAQDKDAKVACECLITTGQCIIAGEITANAQVDVVAIASNVIKEIGYTHAEWGFDYANARYLNLLHEQSREINDSVVHGGAGDQGLMFGYACNETPELMPLPITLSHRLMERQALLRKEGVIPWLLPDAKAQVTVLYDEQQNPVTVTKVVLSTQHQKGVSQEQIRKKVIDEIVAPVICPFVQSNALEILINPSGSFTIGGPHGDTGLTGRKIIVDTYGGSCPHGGGAFSGKDPSKVDRSAAYMARFIAKHIVAAGLATRATVQLAYAIGVAEPVSVHVNLHGTGKMNEYQLAALISQKIDLTPSGIISRLKLKQTVYSPTASYGHFGRSTFSWEQLDEELLQSMRSKI